MALPMAVVGFQSCQSEDDNQPNQVTEATDEVVVNLKPNTKIRYAFRIINEVKLPVTMMYYGDYVVSLPPDKQKALIDVLKKKDYILKSGSGEIAFGPDVVGNQMFLSLVLLNMHLLSNQTDWLSTMAELGIMESETASIGHIIFFQVPESEIYYYLTLFKRYEAVESADRNGINYYKNALP
jgi:hypothetical protein